MAVQQQMLSGASALKPEATAPVAILDALSQHSRSAQHCLMFFDPDGKLAYADRAAGAFFEHYVIRALETPDAASRLAEAMGRIAAGGHAFIDCVPGVTVCVTPLMERRQAQGLLALAAKREGFSANEEVVRTCGMLALDTASVVQQSARAGTTVPARLAGDLAILLSILSDRIRIAGLEEELTSLSTQLANSYEELTLIDQISGGMRVNRRSADFFRQVCVDVMQVVGTRAMGVALATEKLKQDPVLYGQLKLAPDQLARVTEQLMGVLRERKSCYLINDIAQDKEFNWLSGVAGQLIAVPLLRRDQILGCMFGLDKNNGVFDSVDSKLLTSIGNECAIYIENAILFGDVHGLMMGLLHALTSAVDAKDAYTCGHSERVALLSRHVAAKIALSDHEVERVYMAGLLHDVGKIGVPESVLQKAGRLTNEEFEQMKKHPQIGARILGDVKQLEDIIPGVLYHHERYDGKGYPTGLAGKDIPVMGRIICLADCFDAMTSNRTYRKALPLEVALTEIRRCSGTQFDPELTEAFLKITPDQFRSLMIDHQQQAKKVLELQQSLRAA
jgi:HD-GYP domain-containing protein (c-di-GMP phosphodiesterase class II)